MEHMLNCLTWLFLLLLLLLLSFELCCLFEGFLLDKSAVLAESESLMGWDKQEVESDSGYKQRMEDSWHKQCLVDCSHSLCLAG